MTLNVVYSYRRNPKQLSYAILEGKYLCNYTLIALLEVQIIVYDYATVYSTWILHTYYA